MSNKLLFFSQKIVQLWYKMKEIFLVINSLMCQKIDRNKESIFRSPEHEVLMVSYCDQSLSVVRALSTFCFKRLLLQNGWTDFEIILQEGSLGDPLPKLLKPFGSVEQGGRQS